MPEVKPISRRELIKQLRRLGFDGPSSGTKHDVMIRGDLQVRLPNEHGSEIDKSLLSRILTGAGIKEEWRNL
jgi:hypothetical protein